MSYCFGPNKTSPEFVAFKFVAKGFTALEPLEKLKLMSWYQEDAIVPLRFQLAAYLIGHSKIILSSGYTPMPNEYPAGVDPTGAPYGCTCYYPR